MEISRILNQLYLVIPSIQKLPFPELMEQKFIHRIGRGKSKRLRELYLVEEALYETDICVLGHSFGEPDYEYFEFLVKATQAGIDVNKLSALWQIRNIGLQNMSENDLIEWIQLNIIYATQHRKRELEKDNVPFPKEEMIEKMY